MKLTITVTEQRKKNDYSSQTEPVERVAVVDLEAPDAVIAGMLRTIADDIWSPAVVADKKNPGTWLS